MIINFLFGIRFPDWQTILEIGKFCVSALTLLIACIGLRSWQNHIKGEYIFKTKVNFLETLYRIKHTIESYNKSLDFLLTEFITDKEFVKKSVYQLTMNIVASDFSFGELRRIKDEKVYWFKKQRDELDSIDTLICELNPKFGMLHNSIFENKSNEDILIIQNDIRKISDDIIERLNPIITTIEQHLFT